MLRPFAMTAAAAAIAFVAFAQAPPPAAAKVEDQVADAANAFRAEHGLAALTHNLLLAEEARSFAAYMATTGRFSHTADGREPGQRAKAAGYGYCVLAENIAFEEGLEGIDAARLTRVFMSGWEASPGHRRNLLDPAVTETGVGVARAPGSGHRYLAVQVFGSPISARYRFSVENRAEQPVGYTFDAEHRRLPSHSTLVHDTCATGELIFDSEVRGEQTRFHVTPGATYVVSSAGVGLHVGVEQGARGPDRGHED